MNNEESIRRLEEIAEKLEAQNIDIDEATKLFEEGVGIIKLNYEQLNAALSSKRAVTSATALSNDVLKPSVTVSLLPSVKIPSSALVLKYKLP